MSIRERRLGLAGLALLTGASLLRASISLAFPRPAERPNLTFSLSTAALTEVRDPTFTTATVRAPRSNRRVIETRLVSLPFQTFVRYSRAIPVGATTLVTEGTPGSAIATYRVTYRNGEVASQDLLSYVLLSRPLPRVVLRGSATARLRSQYGQASWYECQGTYAAHLSLPFGTVVTVTNLDNGRSVTVVINDRGPYGIANRIVDLCSTAFAQIAPLEQGVARVKITW